VEEFVEDRLRHVSPSKNKRLSPATVGKILVTLRSALAEADLRENPAARVEAPKVERRVPRIVGTDEAARILDAVEGSWVEAICRFLFGSALRIGEAVSINQSDIDWEHSMVQIRDSKTTIRRVEVTDDAMDALRLALTQAPRRGAHEPVFFSPRARRDGVRDRLLPSSVTHALPRILQGASIEPLTPHGLRHAHATVALENDVALEAIAHQLGHRSLTMTRRYAKVTDELRRSALSKVGGSVQQRREAGR
jgi:integrase